MGYAYNSYNSGAVVSFISNPKSIGFIGHSCLSLISKCKCGPDEPPVFPEKATNAYDFIFRALSFGKSSISNRSL